jgi:DNA gyrase inhibitor GyrI
VFKKIVGLTPAVYRHAEIFFSFEPIRLHERVSYREDREQTELFPDVKVIRFIPGKMYTFLYVARQEAGMENEAFRIVYDKLSALGSARSSKSKARIFGFNVDLPLENGEPRYGYRILIANAEEWFADCEDMFTEEPFVGGLYAVRKIISANPDIVQDGWNRLLSEWLPKSTFDIGTHPYIEEFIAYNGKVTRMNLFLPVQRKNRIEPIEIVARSEVAVYFCRGYGANAQADAEQKLINWLERRSGASLLTAPEQHYFMSFHYGNTDPEQYWWENGIMTNEPGPEGSALNGLEQKRFRPGLYALCVSKTYGLLTGVLDKMYRWIATSDDYRLDEERQWFAEYHAFDGMNAERDAIVKVYIPVK